ncbi:unnamed protein product [Clavelina lepadiformis]|uniref:VCBS repeat-containing protein n=1 Tax=Clavelina lepadiformis TaxID=159417 RepID=A0ABP0GXY8_CLALP
MQASWISYGCLILLIGIDNGCNAFLDHLMKRVQKKWMTSWQRMRDQQVRPRMFAQINLQGSPSIVQTMASRQGNIELAVSLHNATADTVSLLHMHGIDQWLNHRSNVAINTVASYMGWPNAVGKVEGDVIPDSENTYWWMTSTSFPPQGTEGQIVLLPVSKVNSSLPLSPMVVSSSEIEQNWYYSKIEWVDMNQDGWLDVVTSRSRGRSESIQFSQLLWYENPGYGLLWSRGRWRSHTITNGPDMSFEVLRIPLPSGESRLVIIGAGHWDNKLYAVWTEDPEENWANVDAINERVIDNHGWFYDVQVADVNADGRVDIIASTWTPGIKQGSVIVYEIPCDFSRDKWRRHILIDGAVDMPLPDLGSGGKIKIFHPTLRQGQVSQKKKPFILVSGDDEGRVYVLIPNSRRTNDWEYTSHTVYKTSGPVGALAVDDINHDGFMEIIIPVVDGHKLVFFTYKPSEIGPHYFVDETSVASP